MGFPSSVETVGLPARLELNALLALVSTFSKNKFCFDKFASDDGYPHRSASGERARTVSTVAREIICSRLVSSVDGAWLGLARLGWSSRQSRGLKGSAIRTSRPQTANLFVVLTDLFWSL